MVQIQWELEAKVTTAGEVLTATTSGPFHLPAWAPDIAWAPTTTAKGYIVYIGTTSIGLIEGWRGHMRTYTARSFSTNTTAKSEAATTPIMVTYRGVGELVGA
jgi:hypothetical protein